MRTIIGAVLVSGALLACGGSKPAPQNPNITSIEEKIPLDQVPAPVMSAFAAKYPDTKVIGAEKETPTGKAPSYELAFEVDGKKKEATFAADGTFIEEE